MIISIPVWLLWGAGSVLFIIIMWLAWVGLTFLRHWSPPRW